MDDLQKARLREICDGWRARHAHQPFEVEFREPALAFWSFLKFGTVWQIGTMLSSWFSDGRAGVVVETKEGVSLSVPDGHWRPVGEPCDPMDEAEGRSNL
jgi:hypothetical protein